MQIEWECVELNAEVIDAADNEVSRRTSSRRSNDTRTGLKGPVTTPIGGGHFERERGAAQELDLYANFRPVRTLPRHQDAISAT